MPQIPDPRGASPDLMPFLRWVRETLISMIDAQTRQSASDKNTNSSQNSTMSTLVERLGTVEQIMDTISSSLTIDAGQVVSGVFAGARIPNLDASKIVSGTLGVAVNTGGSIIGAGIHSNGNLGATGDVSASGNGTFNQAWNYDVSAITRRGVWMDSAGRLGHTSSSLRGKADIEDWSPEEAAMRSIRTVRFHRRYGLGLLEGKWDHGVIAEELHDLGLDWLVSYGVDGVTPEGVQYEMFGFALLPLVQRLADEVDTLTIERNDLHARLEDIETRLASLEEQN